MSTKYLCKYCNVFVQNNPLQKKKHESTPLHTKRREEKIQESLQTKFDVNKRVDFGKKIQKEETLLVDQNTGLPEWEIYVPPPKKPIAHSGVEKDSDIKEIDKKVNFKKRNRK
eukprot:NODE_109_length_18665_cov_0.924486.p21 type:complete len:113 gc:universal NODE_109_length_18665_cov_0.924486:17674-18012(+)